MQSASAFNFNLDLKIVWTQLTLSIWPIPMFRKRLTERLWLSHCCCFSIVVFNVSEMNIKTVLEVSGWKCYLPKDILNSFGRSWELCTVITNARDLCSVPELIQLHMLGFDRSGWKVVFVGAVDPQQMIWERNRPRNLPQRKQMHQRSVLTSNRILSNLYTVINRHWTLVANDPGIEIML